MNQVISAIQRQIKLEEGKEISRQMMLSNKSDVLFDKPLTESNPEYLQELKKVLPILEYINAPLVDWCKEDDGSIDVPDNLMPLLNKIGMQLRFHTISGKSEMLTIIHILRNAQEFFHGFIPTAEIEKVGSNGI